jgi:hypothetical protein
VCVYVCVCVSVCLGKRGMWTELMWFRVETVEEFVQGNDQLDLSCEK